jgi:hypothetical protein
MENFVANRNLLYDVMHISARDAVNRKICGIENAAESELVR